MKKFGRLPERLLMAYIPQVLEGLAFLHEQGVVHRDIKGANILISSGGRVKLADFGVAAKMGTAVNKDASTEKNSVVGTPYWMAPEIIQMSGFTTSADIWSVGCTVHELITGAPPYFDLAPMSALFKIVNETRAPIPPNISSTLHDFLMQCFQKDPNQRPRPKLLLHPWLTTEPDDEAAAAGATGRATDGSFGPMASAAAAAAAAAGGDGGGGEAGDSGRASRTSKGSADPNAWAKRYSDGGTELPHHLLPAAATISAIQQIQRAGRPQSTGGGRGSSIGWRRMGERWGCKGGARRR